MSRADMLPEDLRDAEKPMNLRSGRRPAPSCPECSHEFDRREWRAFQSPFLMRRRSVPCPSCGVSLTCARGPWRSTVIGFAVFVSVAAYILIEEYRLAPASIEDEPEIWVLVPSIIGSSIALIWGLVAARVERA